MNKSQAIADLSLALSRVTTADQSATLIRRALRVTGLTNASTISPLDMDALLEALAAEGGIVQALAEDIAANGLDPEPRAA